MKNRHKTHGGANMGKDRNPNAEIALPVNAFLVQSGFREKGKKNDYLASVKTNISIMASKTEINTHLAFVFGRD